MITKTTGIVFHSFKYGETSIIVRIFTKDLGLQSYIIPGVRKQKSKIKQNLFQPLSILELVAYHKERGGLQHIREISCPNPFNHIPYDIAKSSIAIFLAEILHHSLKNHEPNPPLFTFIHDAVEQLDQTTERVADFHLVFLLQLSRFLGFQPRDNYDKHNFAFNLREGVFQPMTYQKGWEMDKNSSRYFHEVISTKMEDAATLSIPKELRKQLLHYVIDFYRYHLDGMQDIKSHTILEMVLND